MRSIKLRGSASLPPCEGCGPSLLGATMMIAHRERYRWTARGVLLRTESRLVSMFLGVAVRFQKVDLRRD